MALTNATTLADYGAGIGTQGATLKVDATNKRVGVGTDSPAGPEGSLQVGTGITFFGNTGIVSAIGGKFSGDFTVGGTLTYEDVANIDAVGIITAQSHVSIADSILHTGDTDTSIRFPSAGTFTVETNGSERFRVTDSLKEIKNGSLRITSTFIQFSGDVTTPSAAAALYRPADNEFAISTSNTERLRIDSSGRVGIGTDNPGANLHVHGAVGGAGQIYVTDGDAAGTGNSFLISKGGTTTTLKDRQASSNLDFGTADTTAMRIDSSQRLLVGSTSARANTFNASAAPQVQVEGTNANLASIGIFCSANDTDGGRLLLAHQRSGGIGGNTIVNDDDLTGSITFQGNDGTEFVESAAIKAEIDGAPGANDMPGRLTFHTTADGAASASERLRVDSGGQVLINGGNDARSNFHGGGTTYRFQVESTSFETSAPAFICNSNTAGHGPHVTLARSRGTSVGSNTIVQDDDVVGVINFQGNDGTHFENVARIRAEIDGTPGANDMPGRLTFFTVADGSVSPTEALRIDSSQRLLIGTTSAVSTQWDPNLQVVGSDTPCSFVLARNDTTVSADSTLAAIRIFGNDSNGTYEECARISAESDGDHGTGDKPTRLVFSTTADGASSITERLRIDQSGQVGLAEDNPEAPLHIGASDSWIDVGAQSGNRTKLGFNSNKTYFGNSSSVGEFIWRNNNTRAANPWGSGTERMRLTDDGKLRIGMSDFSSDPSASNSGLQLLNTSAGAIISASSVTTNSDHALFFNPNGIVGRIRTSGSATSYNTSSDYRLKENVVDLNGAITRVKQLSPKRFNFISDADTTVDGFLAHEAQTVVPEAVTGTHNEVDDDGNAVMQGIDQSKLVPLLTAALQEAITKIETLEAQVAALQG